MYEKLYFVLILLLIPIISFSLFESKESFAISNIGIKLDKTCEALISIGDVKTCPTYEKIYELYGSDLIPAYSNLIESEQDPANIITNNHKVENFKKSCVVFNECHAFVVPVSHIWLNPGASLSEVLDMITITTNMKIQNSKLKPYDEIASITTDNKRELSFEINQLYISPDCKNAIFTPGDDWEFELGFLIYYIMTNCDDSKVNLSLVFDLTHIETTEIHDFDPLTSRQYNYELWLKESKELCKEKC